jgi:methyl-accepting chemotaxis protein
MIASARLSIQWKITLLAGTCLLLIVALLVAASLYQTRQTAVIVRQSSSSMLEESAQRNLEARGTTQALRIERQFMDAFQYGKGFARQVVFLRDQAIEPVRASRGPEPADARCAARQSATGRALRCVRA